MNFIPCFLKLKNIEISDGYCDAKSINWLFGDETDNRITDAAMRICKSSESGISAYINHGQENSEAYELLIEKDKIKISSAGAAGAFYALQTLKILIEHNNGQIKCCKISDYPDMKYRGFYQDVTRGRIPTLDTLKKLADTMAEHKLNSMQLYIEHTYEFEEYKHCREELGYITEAEIRELDEYCKARFIELIPSLATFGHLYHLLQSDKYKHLCEIADYKPTKPRFAERMPHHTINPLLEESYELITSLIDKHSEAFSSDYFNICGDETFDLGTDVNKGKDKGRLYVDFIKKLIAHLESKGKKVMMWGDIVLTHPDLISEIPDSVIFLNWDYTAKPDPNKAKAFKDKKQIVCPGTTSWRGFCERVITEESNIITLARQGYENGALGILNTNWGDFGHPASIDMAMYGLVLGAAVAWDKKTEANSDLRQSVSKYHYGNADAVDMLALIEEKADEAAVWGLLFDYWRDEPIKKHEFETAAKICAELIDRISAADFSSQNIKEEMLLAAEGSALTVKWNAASEGYTIPCGVDFNKWLEKYREKWLENSKPSELDELVRIFKAFERGELLDISGRGK